MDEISELCQTSGDALFAMLAGAPRLRAQFWKNAALILTGERLAVLNVIMIGPETTAVTLLAETATTARQNQLPLTAFFTPHVATILAPHATRLGFTPMGETPLMVLRQGTTVTPPPTCIVERASSRAAIECAIALRAQGRFPVDPILRTVDPIAQTAQDVAIFIGSKDGVPMSTVTVTEAGDTAGIWWMATPVQYQRLGVGRSLLAQVIATYRQRGTSRFYLIGSNVGPNLYRNLGFETIGQYSLWIM